MCGTRTLLVIGVLSQSSELRPSTVAFAAGQPVQCYQQPVAYIFNPGASGGNMVEVTHVDAGMTDVHNGERDIVQEPQYVQEQKQIMAQESDVTVANF